MSCPATYRLRPDGLLRVIVSPLAMLLAMGAAAGCNEPAKSNGCDGAWCDPDGGGDPHSGADSNSSGDSNIGGDTNINGDPASLDRAALIALLNGLPYEQADMFRPRGPASLSISQEVTIPGTVQIAVTDLADPCVIGTSCIFRGFMLFGDLPDVTVDPSGGVTFVDATVRFRGIFQDNHPEMPQLYADLYVVPASSEPCPAEITRCPSDRVCYQNFPQHCAYCSDLSPHLCACQTWLGQQPEGEPCNFWMSGDMLYGGACTADGECQQCAVNGDCNPGYCWPRYWLGADGEELSMCYSVGCQTGTACASDYKCCGPDSCSPGLDVCPAP